MGRGRGGATTATGVGAGSSLDKASKEKSASSHCGWVGGGEAATTGRGRGPTGGTTATSCARREVRRRRSSSRASAGLRRTSARAGCGGGGGGGGGTMTLACFGVGFGARCRIDGWSSGNGYDRINVERLFISWSSRRAFWSSVRGGGNGFWSGNARPEGGGTADDQSRPSSRNPQFVPRYHYAFLPTKEINF